jgi:hypothetical protein
VQWDIRRHWRNAPKVRGRALRKPSLVAQLLVFRAGGANIHSSPHDDQIV